MAIDSLFEPRGGAAVLDRLRALTPDAERRWGRMSVHQMVCHLSDAFRHALGERDTPARSYFAGRTLLRWGALHTPIPWPKGTATLPAWNQERGGTRPSDFERDRAGLVSLAERFIASEATLGGRAHPLFGPLTATEWGRWGYRHADHHLRQFGLSAKEAHGSG